MRRFDFVIVGAGIAGAGLAAELAPHASVLLLESEDVAGAHSTGRSAAFWSETYGGPGVQPLTTASGPWLRQPPARFGGEGFLGARGALHIGRAGDEAALAALAAEGGAGGVRLERVDPAAIVPDLREGWTLGLFEPSCADIDVARLHTACLAAAKRSGAELRTGAQLRGGERDGGGWRLDTAVGPIAAAVVVNAAGGWADAVARACGVAPLGIRPHRRTIAQVRVDPPAPAALPLVIDLAGRFYFKPEAGGRLWLSPHDETPVEAGDAAAEEVDVAIAIDRFERVVDWRVAAVERRWAGLRSFAPDRLPVYGFDCAAPGFFWCAGQGGFGIQTAPAAAMLAAALALGQDPAPMVAGIDPGRYAPGRFRTVTS